MSFLIDFSPPHSENFMNRAPQRLVTVIIFTLVLTLHGRAMAATTGADSVGLQEAGTSPPATFEYVLENREDPFVPFITEKAATSQVDMNEIVDVENTLTGMQLFEPGQLNLVALMKSGTENIAMVEDFTGKGYILTEGTLIGRRGVVKDIALNKVLIEETAYTRAGKKIVTEVVMLLKKEGEE